MSAGFRAPEFFDKERVEATATVEDLWRNAKQHRQKLLENLGPGDLDKDMALHRGTVKEYHRGTMLGPFLVQEADKLFGSLWLPARRFCIQQGTEVVDGKLVPKFRQIDDYSEYGHNAAASLEEKIAIDDTDSTIGLVRVWAKALSGDTIRI